MIFKVKCVVINQKFGFVLVVVCFAYFVGYSSNITSKLHMHTSRISGFVLLSAFSTQTTQIKCKRMSRFQFSI